MTNTNMSFTDSSGLMTKKTLRKKEVRAEIKNHFSPNKYSNYVSGDELPFIDIRKKMQIRGAK